MKEKLKIGFSALVGVALAGLLALYPLDYYIMKPGGAYEIGQFVAVADGDIDDEGTMNLMTIAMMQASPLTYALSYVLPNRELLKTEEVRYEDEDDEAYNIRQMKLMTDSQFNAKYVAFGLAGKEVDVTSNGIFVLNVLRESAADGILQPGDEIIQIAGQTIDTTEDVQAVLRNREQGEQIVLSISRGSKVLEETVTLKNLPGEERVGVGITYAGNQTIETTPEVTMKAEDIGGPSAGLMFTLEIYNQLVEEDITKGYHVAGTGEMLMDGTVGRIGGADYKVVAADRDNMDIFFVPDDVITDDMRAFDATVQSNYEEALTTAKDIDTDMKIVPVKTVQDALRYLDSLPPKE